MSVAVTALNPLGARLYQMFENEKEVALADRGPSQESNGIWIRQGDREGQVVIHADGVEANGATLLGATFMFFEVQQDALRFTRRIRAARAELMPGFWQLTDLVEAVPGGRPVPQTHLAIPTTIDATELINRFVTPATLSFWTLPGFIREARAAGFAPTRYELKLQSLLAFPLLLAAMAALGAAFSLQLQRLGNLARWGAGGVGYRAFPVLLQPARRAPSPSLKRSPPQLRPGARPSRACLSPWRWLLFWKTAEGIASRRAASGAGRRRLQTFR